MINVVGIMGELIRIIGNFWGGDLEYNLPRPTCACVKFWSINLIKSGNDVIGGYSRILTSLHGLLCTTL